MTVFWGWSDSAYVGSTLNPRALSVEVACAIGSPMTFGTATGVGPFDTLIRTFVPWTTFVPGDGSCAVTTFGFAPPGTPCSSGTRFAALSAATASVELCPRTSGTATFGLPVETQIVTSLPFACRLPGFGSWL